jgi:histidinol-phosphate aminotransferase
MNIDRLVRTNIQALKPYSCARDEFKGEAAAYLDANENPLNAPYNRYPDPMQWALKEKIAQVKAVAPSRIFLGNGSDEPIDLLIRVFCEPGRDNIVAIDPTYGMYRVAADINNVEYRTVALGEGFTLEADTLLAATDAATKLVFLCSPNNPTGNDLDMDQLMRVVERFEGIVVVDEAYIDFSRRESLLRQLDQYPNLVVLQTFSKAWGLAAVRLGMAFASETVVGYLNKVKYPYNINLLTQNFVSDQLSEVERKNDWVDLLLQQRCDLIARLEKLPMIRQIYPSDANFILVRVDDANAVYHFLVDQKIIVRNRNSVALCLGCLRITVGLPEENELLLAALKKFTA